MCFFKPCAFEDIYTPIDEIRAVLSMARRVASMSVNVLLGAPPARACESRH